MLATSSSASPGPATRLELLRLVVLCDQLVGHDACPAHVLLLLVAQVVDAVADGFRQRIGER